MSRPLRNTKTVAFSMRMDGAGKLFFQLSLRGNDKIRNRLVANLIATGKSCATLEWKNRSVESMIRTAETGSLAELSRRVELVDRSTVAEENGQERGERERSWYV